MASPRSTPDFRGSTPSLPPGYPPPPEGSSCCCAAIEGAGAGFPTLPAVRECGITAYDEGCVPEPLCHLDGPLPEGLKDARGGETGIARTLTLSLEDRPSVDVVIPAGAALTHPKSNLIVYRGALSVIHEAVVSQITQVGYAADGVPVLAADAPTEIYGDSFQTYAQGETRLAIAVDEDCQGVSGLSCVVVQ